MLTIIRHPQEVSAAIGLLQAWGVIQKNEYIPHVMVEEVVKKYVKHRLYDFGSNLFEHLVTAATKPNRWALEGPASSIGAVTELEKFLYETTTASTQMGMTELRGRFREIKVRIKKEYGVDVKYDNAAMPLQNIRRAEKEEAALWVAAHKAEQKGA